MEQKIKQYHKMLAIIVAENAESDDEVTELPIKTKIREERDVTKAEKISQALLSEAFRWRLSQNDCQNRGYVLDGYPLCYQTAEQVFVITPDPPKKPEPVLDEEGNEVPQEDAAEVDEEALAEMLKPKFQSHIYPDSVIYMRGDDEFIRDRARELCKQSDCKWDRENLERRLAKFHENNDLTLFVTANTDPDMGLPSAKKHKLPITRFY